ncbi:AMP-binding protein [Pseudonocardia sp. GCM10023141]|uniref:AMP-binding protein n=1 Tax=Pseudonocardia sp. GCM10023141 TaxID=3252653 RepID=UPI00360C87CC
MGTRLRDVIRNRAADDPHGQYLVDARSDRVVHNADLAAAALRWSRALASHGVPPGARVLIDVDDPIAFAVVHLSVIAAGRCSAPVSPEAGAAELERARRALRPVLVVTDRDGRPGMRVDAATGMPAVPTNPTPGHAGAVAGSAALLTSGSTCAPKTVVLSEEQLLHVAGAVARHNRLTPADRGYNALPLFHINAQVVALLATLVSGATLVLESRFHRSGFWERLAAHDVTWLNAVPAVLTILSRDEIPVLPPRLRFVRSASASLAPAVRELVVAGTGVPLVESYGMTEAASQITATPLDGAVRPGSAGRPVDVELQVIGPDGTPCPTGDVGRVRIRGAGVIRSYADGAAADRIDAEHWLDTADLGRLDADGYLYLVGRADDVVNRGGELIYPREIEEVLLGEPGVADAVVVGRPDDVLGAVPVACIRTEQELADDAGAALVERLTARCARELARYKRPADIQLFGAFPLAPTGKVRRTEVRRLVAEDSVASGR